jgi:hypothetical protein
MLLSIAHAIDGPKHSGLGFIESAVLSSEIKALFETDRMTLLRILNVDLTLY